MLQRIVERTPMNHPMSHSMIDSDAPPRFAGPDRLTMLRALERRILWLSTWMIHHANHVRPNHRRTEGGRPPGELGIGARP